MGQARPSTARAAAPLALVDGDGHLGVRADVQLGEDEQSEPLQHRILIDLDARLVVDLDDGRRLSVAQARTTVGAVRDSCAC